MGSQTSRKAAARRTSLAWQLAYAGVHPDDIARRAGISPARAWAISRAMQKPARLSEGEELFSRTDLEDLLVRRIAQLDGDIERAAEDPSEENAAVTADARVQKRELEEELAASQAKSLGGSREAALADREQRLKVPASSDRVELDRRVKEHMQATGLSYVEAARQLAEMEG